MTSVDLIFGLLSLLSFLLGLPGNILSTLYFLSRTPTPNTLTYILINLTDITICSLALFIGLSNLSPQFGVWFFSAVWVCNTWGVLWNISIRMSVYLIAVLSISRVYKLHYPNLRTSIYPTITAVGTYLLLLTLQAVIPYTRGVGYTYLPEYCLCSWRLSDLFTPGTAHFTVSYFVLNILEFVVPTVPVTVCCVAMISKLRGRVSVNKQIEHIKRQATVTVVLLTVVYLLWNVPICVVTILNYHTQVTEQGQHPRHFHFTYSTYLRSFINTQTIVLNSVCNTVLYYCRIKGLRQFAMCWVRDRLVRSVVWVRARIS